MQFVVGGVAVPDAQVPGDGVVEEVDVLADQSDHGANSVAGQAVERQAVQGDRAGLDGQEAEEDRRQGRFPGAAWAHDGHPAPGRQ